MFDKYYEARQTAHNQIDAIGTTFDLWRFTSFKSNKDYEILIEKFHNKIYGVKFYLRSQRKSKFKYSYMTYDGEANVIIRTVIQTMLHYIDNEQNCSFIIIGARNADEEQSNVKRYVLYKKIIKLFVSNTNFYHYDHPERSIYMLLRKHEVDTGNITNADIVNFIDEQQN